MSADELRHENEEYEVIANMMLDALLLIRSNDCGESYSAGVAMSCIEAIHERDPRARGKVPRFLPTWLGGEADRVSGTCVRLEAPSLLKDSDA